MVMKFIIFNIKEQQHMYIQLPFCILAYNIQNEFFKYFLPVNLTSTYHVKKVNNVQYQRNAYKVNVLLFIFLYTWVHED